MKALSILYITLSCALVMVFYPRIAIAEFIPEEDMSLLNGRLLVTMPKGTRSNPPIPELSPSVPDETQVIFDEGEKRLFLMVYELFSTVGKDVEQHLQHELNIWEQSEQIDLTLHKHTAKHYMVYPSTFVTRRNTIFI